jgi:hypothetical protein
LDLEFYIENDLVFLFKNISMVPWVRNSLFGLPFN